MKTASIIFLYVAIGAIIIAGFILQRNVNRMSRIIKDTQCPKAGNTFEAWVAKDLSDGIVFMYREEPIKLKCESFVCGEDNRGFLEIPSSTVPDLTFDNSPQRVRLTIEKI
jgi:hypothetical protein